MIREQKRNHMNKRILLTRLILFVCITPLSADPLWNTAVSYFSHADDWYASGMETVSRQLDTKGKLKELWEIEFILPPGKDEDDWEMIKAYKDGHLATDKELKGRDKGMQSGPPGGYFEGVETLALDTDEAERVHAVNTGKTVRIDGESVLVYSFTHTYQSGAETAGEVFITSEGFPVTLNYSFTNLPFYMKKMSNRFSFYREGEAAIVQTMWMDGDVSILFFNMNFLTKITFSDYQKRQI